MCFYYKVHIYKLQSVNLFLLCHGEKTLSPAELYHCVCGDRLFIPRPGKKKMLIFLIGPKELVDLVYPGG